MADQKTDHETGTPHNPGVKERSHLPFPVVGLGASAGGLVAVKRFLENMPKAGDWAFVVILHLSPKHESIADKVLQPSTSIPVVQVSEPTPLQPGHVYVISPNQELTMSDGCLRVAPSHHPRGRHVAIDLFFRTLADTHQDRAVGIVFSGTGADGAVGIARIKEQGGVTFAQAPEDAEYEDMPRNAIASGHVDFVLPVADMPDKLLKWWDNARAIQLPRPEPGAAPIARATDTSEEAESALRDILDVLAARSGHDFHHYKRATVLRRIERRMQVNLVKSLPAYRDFLRGRSDESAALLDDMLIGVTNFFRDREAFEALEREVIPEILESRKPPEQTRVWVPGCATGEEAYSIAMLLADHSDTLPTPPQYQVFASDIDEAALRYGRAGVYPESIVTDVPPTRLRQFFSREQGRYRVHKSIRDRVLFALHNVLRDPPFSHVDLISCRNLLIYLERNIQERLLELFHFALRPGGVLFLGSSESVDAASPYFETMDKHHRIYRARALSRSARQFGALPLHPAAERATAAESAAQRPRRGFSFADVHQRVLEFYAPPSVIVDRESNIVHVSEHASRYLRFGAGEPTTNLVAVADPALRTDLRSTLFQALHGNKSVEARVKLEQPGKPPRFVNIVVRPFRDPEADAEFVLVLFDEVEDALGPSLEPAQGQDKSRALLNLEEELQRTRERLQVTTEQYETSNEELKASNEELQAINEELRSATEELETSKEELQSINEELTTVNDELKQKVEELARSNDDLHNFISSSDIAVLFVDPGLRIKRYTPRAADLFSLIPGDVGRSLLDITSRLDYPNLAQDASAAFESLRVIEREVRSAEGRWYAARVLPYRTGENRIDGAVLVFVDTTSLRRAEERVSFSEEQLRVAVHQAREYAVIVCDGAGQVTAWNEGAEKLFGWNADEMIGHGIQQIFTPEDIEAKVPQLEFASAGERGNVEEDRWHLRRDGGRVHCSGVLSRIDHAQFHGFVKIVRDTTQRELRALRGDAGAADLEKRRREAEAAITLKDDFLAVISHELKNPLNLISVNTELLTRLMRDREPRSPQVDAALAMIRRAIHGQGKIIDDLLDMSRIRTGKLALNMEAVDLGAVACSIAETARADLAASGLSISCNVPEETVVVRADPARLEQIVWNLVSNAMKFTPPGGSITLRIDTENNFGRLTVTDTGQGIEPDFISRIFEMFGQAPARALSGKGGLGIGLALVRQLVERHNGRIAVHSDGIGKGASFSVWLPRFSYATLGAAPPDETSPESGRWQGVKVLIADDAAEAIGALAQLLEMEGAQVTVAHDGAEALARFRENPTDIVFADIGMPNMDGYEFARHLREISGDGRVPLVAMTGFTRSNDVDRALKAGFDAHIGKPLSIGQLTATMQRLLRTRERDGNE